MNAKKSERTLKAAFNEIADKDQTISATQLTDLIAEFTQRETLSDKTVRAHLRKIQARDQSQMKNAVWRIDYALAESEVKHFTRKQAQASQQLAHLSASDSLAHSESEQAMSEYEVLDDSGEVQHTLTMTRAQARDLEEQLPEGWYLSRLD